MIPSRRSVFQGAAILAAAPQARAGAANLSVTCDVRWPGRSRKISPGRSNGDTLRRVGGWSVIGASTGTPFGVLPDRIGAETTARASGLDRAKGHHPGFDMPAAPHPRTWRILKRADDILPTRHGCPFKPRIPTKLESNHHTFVTTQQPRGVWTDRGDNWFSGI
jgi:DMSO/TMAO reductase YedYZ molybdopterin-dependent catalytic subunit